MGVRARRTSVLLPQAEFAEPASLRHLEVPHVGNEAYAGNFRRNIPMSKGPLRVFWRALLGIVVYRQLAPDCSLTPGSDHSAERFNGTRVPDLADSLTNLLINLLDDAASTDRGPTDDAHELNQPCSLGPA